MEPEDQEGLGIIAGKGAYPKVLAESARAQGVRRLVAVAFRGETSRDIGRLVDEVTWLRVGQLQALLDWFAASGVRQVVMAGQITPTHLFRVRPDRTFIALLSRLPERNAHTIFGAIGAELAALGITLRPASLFMEAAMPEAGVLTRRKPTEQEEHDIELGLEVARRTSSLDIGQTVVVKEGTILAVEAFEGTDEALWRAGRLGGAGAVVVKVAKPGHDMRFDIPVVGARTLKVLRKIRAGALAVQARRCILLERARLVALAETTGLAMVAMDPRDEQEEETDHA